MKIKCAILFGGDSVEHEVSIISAIQAMNACDNDKVEVIPIYVSKQRDFYYFNEIPEVSEFSNMEEMKRNRDKVCLVRKDGHVVVEPINKRLFQKTYTTLDIAIPVMHGTNGEDGSIQGLFEMLNLPYAGCDVVAAGCGQDKVVMKHILENSDIPTVPWCWLYAHEFERNEQDVVARIEKLGYPVVIKPATLGSSVGITIARCEEDLKSAISESSQYDQKIIVESMVQNLREVNASVLGDITQSQVSVLEEVSKEGHEILDFEKKYLSGAKGAKGTKPTKGASKSSGMASTARIVPAPISEELTKEIQELALKTFSVLGASGVCRIDFMIDNQTNEVFVNEINTIPGSLAFYLWQETGVDFPSLMDHLVRQAIDRQRRREKMITSFDSNILASFKK